MIKYKFRDYNKNYPVLFEKEKARLKKIVMNAKIEHVGSTAVKGLGGKGIIDVLICVPKNKMLSVKEKLIKMGYKFSLTGGDKDRLFFYKDYGFFNKRRLHLHLTYLDSRTSKVLIKFRDKLNNNLKLREEYALIKKKAVLLNKKEKEYRDFKKEFIEKVVIMKWYQKNQ